MRTYGRVQNAFWDEFKSLGADAKLLAVYLQTCRHANALGAFHLPDAYIADDLDWELARVCETLSELSRKGFATRFEGGRHLFLHHHLRDNTPENPNVAKAMVKQFDVLPDGSIKDLVCRAFLRLGSIIPEAFRKRFETPSETLSEPFRNIEPEPEREPIRVPKKEPSVGAKAPTGYAPEFEEFWKAYPRTQNMSKSEAGKAWAKLAKAGLLAEQPKMLTAVQAYRGFLAAQSKGRKEPHPPAHAVTWLNQRRYEGFLEAAPPRNGAAIVDTGPGWEAAFPKWAEVRAKFREQTRGDEVWQFWFAKLQPLSETEFICQTRFEREQIIEKFGERLAGIMGKPLTFRLQSPAATAH